MTNYDNFSHDAYWKYDEDTLTFGLIQRVILENNHKYIRKYKFHIPEKNNILEMLEKTGFKVINIINMKDSGVDDIEFYILKKNI